MATTADDGAPTPRRGSGVGAWWVGVGIFLSRISGLVREIVFARYFGTSAIADVWRAALRTPNVLQNLLGEGTLSASFIPLYAEMIEQGRREAAGRFAGAILGLVTVAAFGAAAVGVALAPFVMPIFFPRWDPAQVELGVRVVRVLFVMTATLVVSAWALGVLNSHRRFLLSYAAPVAWNGALIATMLYFGGVRGWSMESLVVALAWGGIVGGLLQLAVQLPAVKGLLRGFRLSIDHRVEGVVEAVRNFLPVVAARGAVNLSGLVDIILAGLLADGAIALLGYAQTLYLFPIALFGMSIAAAELPELSRDRGGAAALVADRVRIALDRLGFLLVPTTLAYLLLGDLFVAMIFQGGRFGPESTAATYAVLAAYTLGLPASAASRTLSSSFYALRDTRTPARIAGIRVALSALLGVVLMVPFDRLQVGPSESALHLGAVGLALAAAAGAWLEYGLLRARLGARIGPHGPDGGRRLRRWAAGLMAALVALAAKVLLGSLVPDPLSPDSRVTALLLGAGTAALFGGVYLGAAHLLGVGVSPSALLRRRR